MFLYYLQIFPDRLKMPTLLLFFITPFYFRQKIIKKVDIDPNLADLVQSEEDQLVPAPPPTPPRPRTPVRSEDWLLAQLEELEGDEEMQALLLWAMG